MNTDERDREIATAWRAASRDEPPTALDDAIRAAARRAVGAGPSRARHMRTWPLAAAAVMAVFAVGLLQLTPPEQVTPGMEADLSVQRQKAQSEAKPAGVAAPVIADAARNDAPVQVASNAAPADGSAKHGAASATPAAPAASGTAPALPNASVAASVAALEKRNLAVADAPKRSVAEAPEQERVPRLARKELSQAPTAPPPVASQPPDTARMREQARDDVAIVADRRESDKKNKQEPGVTGGGAAGVTAPEAQATAKTRADPFPATSAQDKVAAGAPPAVPALPSMLAPAPATTPAPAPPPSAPAAASPPPMSALNRPAPAPAEATGALSARRDAAPAAMPEKLAKDSAPRPAEEWIRLIRKLQGEGRNDDVVKELTAFRAAYKERADALLPADLRAIKP